MSTKLKTKKTKLKKALRPHRERIAWLLVLVLLLLLVMAWWRPVVRSFDNLTGLDLMGQKTKGTGTLSDAQSKAPTAASPTGTTNTNSTTRTTESTTTGTSGGGSTTASNPGGSTSNPSGGGSTGGGTTGGGDTTGTGTTSSPLLYAKVGNGQDLSTVVSLAGSQPSSCTAAVSLPLLGTQQVCTFLNNGTGVTVTLLNNQVVAKAPLGF